MPEDERNVYEFGPFRLDTVERQLFREGSAVALTDKVFELLLLLVRNRGHALGKAELMDRLWPDTVVEENNLTVNVSLLRKALGEAASERRYIETLARRGYRFVGTLRSELPAVAAPAPAAVGTSASAVHFVGREAEIARLERLFERARAGHGRVVFVTGAPGMGKTELCEQFLARLSPADSLASATGHCFEHYGTSEAYLPFLEALGALLRGPDAEIVARLLRRHAPTWSAQFPELPDANGETGSVREIRGASAASMVRELSQALEAFSRVKPLLLVLEDLHWADPSSIDALRVIAERIGAFPALVLVTFRAEQAALEHHPLRNLERELLARARCEELALPLLDPASISSYLEARFSPHDFPNELAQLIARRSEGQPLFATRLVQLLVDRGDLRKLHDRYRLVPPVAELELGVPDSVRGLIERKFESLQEPDRLALRYASVLGVEFNSALLAALLDLDEVALEERLDRLARPQRLIELLGEERLPDGRFTSRYRFAHVLYQEVLYASLASQRRLALHAQVAARLIDHYGATAPRIVTQLALHFEAAKDFARAVECWLLAGDNASRLHATREATQHFVRALALVDELEPSERIGPSLVLLYNQAWCRSKVGDHAEGLRTFERMLDAAESPDFTGDSAAAQRARDSVFAYFEEPWSDAFGVSDLPRMPAQPRSLGAAAIQCECYWGICYTLLESDQLDQLGIRAKELLSRAEATANEPRRVEALAWFSARELKLSNLERAIHFADESIRGGRAIGHVRALFVALHARARAHYRLGEYEIAEALFLECVELTIEAQGRIELTVDLGRTQAQRGKVSVALATLQQARAIAERTEHDGWTRLVHHGCGALYLELGDFTRARTHHELGLAAAQRLGDAVLARASRIQLARVEAEAGKEIEALLGLDPALDGATEAPEAAGTGSSSRDRSRLEWARAVFALDRGRFANARMHAQRLLELATAHRALRHTGVARNLLSRAALGSGEPGAAEREARTGLAALGEREVPFVRLQLLAALGAARLRSGQRRQAREALEGARDIVLRVGSSIDEAALRRVWFDSRRAREIQTLLDQASP